VKCVSFMLPSEWEVPHLGNDLLSFITENPVYVLLHHPGRSIANIQVEKPADRIVTTLDIAKCGAKAEQLRPSSPSSREFPSVGGAP